MEIRTLDKQRRKSQVGYDNDKAVRSALLELMVFLLFLTAATIVVLSTHHLFMFYMNKTMRNLFVKGNEDSKKYEDMVTTDDWWNYLENAFLDNLHGRTREGGNADTDKRMVLKENVLLGPPRLRQIRVLPDTCEVHESFSTYFDTCYAAYLRSIEDTRDEWKGTKFFTLEELNAVRISAKVGVYVGGGFVKDLTFDYESNKEIIKALKDAQWIDRGTRFVVMEFALYNDNIDLYNNVKFIVEIPPIGGVIHSARTQALSSHALWTSGDYLVIVCAVVFYVMLIYYTIENILEVRRSGLRAYMRSKWNILDLIILILAYLTLIYNIWHPIYMARMLKRMNESPDTYTSLDEICFWNWIYLNIWAICAFSVWIKVLKFMSFNKTMLQFSTTLRRCAKDLLGFGLMFSIVFLAYAALGLLLFGSEHVDFRDFPESVLTMMRMVLGDFEYRTLEETNRILGPIFFLSYILLVFFILLNMFLAIINDTYSGVKGEIQVDQSYLQDYLGRTLRRLFDKVAACCKKKPSNKTPKNENQQTPRTSLDRKSSDETNPPEWLSQPWHMRQKDYFVDLHTSESSMQPNGLQRYQQESEQIERLSNRINRVEKMVEELVESMDTILKKLDDKKKSKSN